MKVIVIVPGVYNGPRDKSLGYIKPGTIIETEAPYGESLIEAGLAVSPETWEQIKAESKKNDAAGGGKEASEPRSGGNDRGDKAGNRNEAAGKKNEPRRRRAKAK